MDKRIGKRLFTALLFLFSTSLWAASVDMYIVDMDGKPVTALYAGTQYMLEITVDGVVEVKNITIEGLQEWYHEFHGASRVTIMSKTSSHYTYIIRADREGKYRVGPARILTTQGASLYSKQLDVSVIKEKQPEVMMQLYTEATNLVVGEPFTVHARLLSTVPVDIVGVHQDPLDKTLITISGWEQAGSGSTVVQGITYEYREWVAQCTSHVPGTIYIPAITTTCMLTKQQKHPTMFGILLQHLSKSVKKQIRSAPLSLTIDPLPAYPYPIDGIGQFTECTLQLAQKEACVGEGVVLTLSLAARHDITQQKEPQLTLPAGLKYYASTACADKKASGIFYKTYEYIVQAERPGLYTIAPQTFHFFNTNTRTFQTLSTAPQQLTITGQQKYTEGQKNTFATSNSAPTRAPLYEGMWYEYHPRSIAWLYFWFMFFVPLVLGVGYHGWTWAVQQYGPHTPRGRYANAYKRARSRLLALKKSGNIAQLHAIFFDFFADRWGKEPAAVTSEQIAQAIAQAGFSGEQQEQWKRFWLLVEQHTFHAHFAGVAPEELCNRALLWLDQLEKKI